MSFPTGPTNNDMSNVAAEVIDVGDGQFEGNGGPIDADQLQKKIWLEKIAKMERENKRLHAELDRQKLIAQFTQLQSDQRAILGRINELEKEQKQRENGEKWAKAFVDQSEEMLALIRQLAKKQQQHMATSDLLLNRARPKRARIDVEQTMTSSSSSAGGGNAVDSGQNEGGSADQSVDQQQLMKAILALGSKLEKEQEQMTNSDLLLNTAQRELCGRFTAIENFVAAQNGELSAKVLMSFEQFKASHNAFVVNVEQHFSNLQLENYWDADACHSDLEITGKNCLSVYQKKKTLGWRSVFAKHSIRSSKSRILYFEVKFECLKPYVGIGLATKTMPLLNENVGYHWDSYGYISNGQFWISGSRKSGQPTFSVGDVVGCGVNLANRQLFFTKNGQRLDTFDLSLSSPIDSLFPCVSLFKVGDQIEANFGPHFQFDVGTLC